MPTSQAEAAPGRHFAVEREESPRRAVSARIITQNLTVSPGITEEHAQ